LEPSKLHLSRPIGRRHERLDTVAAESVSSVQNPSVGQVWRQCWAAHGFAGRPTCRAVRSAMCARLRWPPWPGLRRGIRRRSWYSCCRDCQRAGVKAVPYANSSTMATLHMWSAQASIYVIGIHDVRRCLRSSRDRTRTRHGRSNGWLPLRATTPPARLGSDLTMRQLRDATNSQIGHAIRWFPLSVFSAPSAFGPGSPA
jgi:hypothetical protein